MESKIVGEHLFCIILLGLGFLQCLMCLFFKEISFYAYLRSRSGAARRSSISGQEVLLTRQPKKQAAAPVMFGPCTEMEMSGSNLSTSEGARNNAVLQIQRCGCASSRHEETLPGGV